MPSVSEALDSFILRARQVSDMWLDINGATNIPDFTPPLILRDGTTQVAFLARIAALETTAKRSRGWKIRCRSNAVRATPRRWKFTR